MAIQNISPVTTTKSLFHFGENLTNHNLTKASLDAPILSELAGLAPAHIRANYFPFDVNVESIEVKAKNTVKNLINEEEYFSDCALHH